MHNNETVSFAELYVNKSAKVIEIYNVYTHDKRRRLGYNGILLEVVKTRYPGFFLWLGVKPNNEPAIKSYVKAGFTSKIKYTKKSPFGHTFDFYFIQMVYNPKKPKSKVFMNANVKRALAKIKQKQNYNSNRTNHGTVNRQELEILDAKFILTADFMKQVSVLLRLRNNKLNKEYGGQIVCAYQKGIKNYDKNGKMRLVYRSLPKIVGTTLYQGSGDPNNVSKFRTSYPMVTEETMKKAISIPFHTHPKKCYALANVCMGLPSSPDILSYIGNFLKGPSVTGFDVVFADEAVYICSFRRSFMTYVLSRNKEQRMALVQEFENRKDEIRQAVNSVSNKGGSLQAFQSDNNKIRYRNYLWNVYKTQLENIKIGGHFVYKLKIAVRTEGEVTFNGPLLMRHHKIKKTGFL